jgi:hypothetical protein
MIPHWLLLGRCAPGAAGFCWSAVLVIDLLKSG